MSRHICLSAADICSSMCSPHIINKHISVGTLIHGRLNTFATDSKFGLLLQTRITYLWRSGLHSGPTSHMYDAWGANKSPMSCICDAQLLLLNRLCLLVGVFDHLYNCISRYRNVCHILVLHGLSVGFFCYAQQYSPQFICVWYLWSVCLYYVSCLLIIVEWWDYQHM